MKVLLSFLFVLMSYSCLWAQDSTFVTIKAGNKIKDVLTTSDIFFYPHFISGKVYFRDGSKGAATLNYNRLFDQMLFIAPKGDTLALADENTIKFIAIDKDTFFYDEGYVRLIADKGILKLAERQTWIVADIKKGGTHNRSTGTVAITSFSTYTDGTDGSKSYDLILNEDMVLKKESQYFFGDEYNHFVRTSKKRLLALFSKDQQSIEDYLKENKINFDKKDDLEKIVQFVAKH